MDFIARNDVVLQGFHITIRTAFRCVYNIYLMLPVPSYDDARKCSGVTGQTTDRPQNCVCEGVRKRIGYRNAPASKDFLRV